MPRIARDYSEIKVYHITIRGIDKQYIFFEDKDKEKFIEIIKNTKEKYNYELYAYCLMDNHVHLVIYDREEKISRIMQSIEISYVFYFNKKYERIGHLFQNRFFSKKVENREYLKMLCRYIHQNPLNAGMAKTEEYKWSSYQSYIRSNKLVDTELLLSVFSKNIQEAKKEFIKFHNIEIKNNEEKIQNIIEYELQDKMTDKSQQIGVRPTVYTRSLNDRKGVFKKRIGADFVQMVSVFHHPVCRKRLIKEKQIRSLQSDVKLRPIVFANRPQVRRQMCQRRFAKAMMRIKSRHTLIPQSSVPYCSAIYSS